MSSKSNPTIQHVSDTAFWVATYRAIESRRKDALFQDPLAQILAGGHGEKFVESMKSVSAFVYWVLVIRTCVIDSMIQKLLREGHTSVINLGAGLDARPYRLNVPSTTQWFEVDFPGVIDYKSTKLKDHQAKCDLKRISCDLSNRSERIAKFEKIAEQSGPAIVLTEGVIPYLDETTVGELAQDIGHQSQFKLWISEYYSPEIYPRYQSEDFKNRLGDSPFLFFPDNWDSFFKGNGWIKKEERFLYDEGETLGRKFPMPWWANIFKYVLGQEKILRQIRVNSYVVYEKNGN